MPNSIIKSYAKKTGKSIEDIEKIWNQAKTEAASKFDSENGSFWAYVNATTRAKLGLKEHVTFKNFIITENHNVEKA